MMDLREVTYILDAAAGAGVAVMTADYAYRKLEESDLVESEYLEDFAENYLRD